jgi:hypothetical protein
MCCSLGHEDVPAYYVGDFEVERDHVEPGVPYCKPCGDNASRMGDYGITGVIGVTWTPQEDAIQQALYALGDHYAPTSATQNVTDAASVYAALRKAGYVLLRMGNLPPDLKVILEDDDLSAPASTSVSDD